MTVKTNDPVSAHSAGLFFIKPWVTPLRPFRVVPPRLKKINDAMKNIAPTLPLKIMREQNVGCHVTS